MLREQFCFASDDRDRESHCDKSTRSPTTTTEDTTRRRRATTPTRADEMRLGRWCSHLPARRYVFASSFSSRADFFEIRRTRVLSDSQLPDQRFASSRTRRACVCEFSVSHRASSRSRRVRVLSLDRVRVLSLDVCGFSISTCKVPVSTREFSVSAYEFSVPAYEFSVLLCASSQTRRRQHRELGANEITHGVSPVVFERYQACSYLALASATSIDVRAATRGRSGARTRRVSCAGVYPHPTRRYPSSTRGKRTRGWTGTG